MYKYRTTTKSISAKDGRVIAPRTKIDVLPPPSTVSDDGWRMAFLLDERLDERETIVTLSERDLNAYTQPSLA
jgi:hypothetical protein